jgi:hypothetical protein
MGKQQTQWKKEIHISFDLETTWIAVVWDTKKALGTIWKRNSNKKDERAGGGFKCLRAQPFLEKMTRS